MQNLSTVRNELVVGWFLLIALLLSGTALVLRPRTKSLIASHELHFELAHGQGLEPGLPVLVQGIPIGELEEVELTPRNTVYVSFHVLPQYVPNLRRDARVEVVPPPLLGKPSVEVHPGLAAEPSESGQLLKASVRLGLLEEVKGELKGVVAEVSTLSASATKTLRELNAILERIERGEGIAGQLVSDPGLADDARETLASVRRAAERVETQGIDEALATLESTKELVEGLAHKDGSLQTLLRDLDQAVIDLRQAVAGAKVEETVATLRRTADSFASAATDLGQEARPLTKDLREALRAMREASQAFRVLSDELARQPESVIWGRKPTASPGLRR